MPSWNCSSVAVNWEYLSVRRRAAWGVTAEVLDEFVPWETPEGMYVYVSSAGFGLVPSVFGIFGRVLLKGLP